MQGLMLLAGALATTLTTVVGADPAPPSNADDRPLIAWLPGPVTCGGQTVAPSILRRPFNSLGWSGSIQGMQGSTTTYTFRIDETGRALSIDSRDNPDRHLGDDIAPSLAATRFAAGSPQAACSITYVARVTGMADTPVEDLASYWMMQLNGPLPWAGWNRIHDLGGTCADLPRPAPLVQAFPDFRTVPATPGVRDWTMLAYDQDASGRPRHIRTLYGTRNAALDTASTRAMRISRYSGGARTGCVYPYWRAPKRLPPPPPPPAESLRPADGTCQSDDGRWAQTPTLTYPEAFRRRAIEGWAIVSFDVAPWGEVGNVRALASEPAAAFGQQAVQVLRSARKAASPTGRSGCVDTVIFRMGPADDEAMEP